MDAFEKSIEEKMGMSFEQYCLEVKAGMTQGSSKDYLCYGKHGKVDLSVKKISLEVPRYCKDSLIIKECNCCSKCN